MAEPIPPQSQPEAQPIKRIIIGETPIYLPTMNTIGGKDIQSFVIQSADKRGVSGINSSVLLIKEASRKKGEEGVMIDKPVTHVDPMDEISWDKISGIQWTDETGVSHIIPKEQLSLTNQNETPAQNAEKRKQTADTNDGSTENAEPKDTMQQSDSEGTLSEEIPKESTTPEIPTAEPPTEFPTEETPDSVKPVVTQDPSRAREILSTMTEDPNTITIVGLRAYETRALDLADRAMQRMGTPRMQERADAAKNLWGKTKESIQKLDHLLANVIWKQSIGGIYFHERARQYYLDMLKASETPFAEQAIRLAEARATERYTKRLSDSNFIIRIGTRAVDTLKDRLGMRTTIQNMALEEIGIMKVQGEIQGAEVFEREAKAIRARFSQDMDKADQFVRSQLGEHLEILDPSREEHRPLVEGIQNLLKRYASGEIADRAEFDKRTKEFFTATLKNVRPDVFAEAELYSSSLFEAAETLRTKMSHEAGLANIDEAIAGMQIRLGMGAMGEVTSLEPTAVERGIGKVREIYEWLSKKSVIVPLLFNEATIGSGIAIALSATNLFKTMPARIFGGIGGGAIAGGLFAGWREYGQLQKEYLTHLRERESGAQFTEGMKKRAWFEQFSVKQRNANEMMTTLQSALYEAPAAGETAGILKANLTDSQLRTAFATIADLQARKAVSEVGPKRIGLVQYSGREAIESERSALDLVANNALTNLESYLSSHDEQKKAVLGGNEFSDFMVKLTTHQTQVLKEGINVMESFDDPVKATLTLVSAYAPEADMIKRRWPFAGKKLSATMTAGGHAEGMDAILAEFNKEARLEAVKYGVKAGVIGAAVGATVHGVSELFASGTSAGGTVHEATQNIKNAIADKTEPSVFVPDAKDHMTGDIHLSPPSADHMVHIGNTEYQLPKELDVVFDAKTNTYDAVLHTGGPAHDLILGNDLSQNKLTEVLDKAGLHLVDAHKAGEALSEVHNVVTIPGMTGPNGEALTTQLPEGFSLTHVTDHHNWQIIDTHGNAVTTVEFTNTGQLQGTSEQLARIGDQLHAQNLDYEVFKMSEVVTPTPITREVISSEMPAPTPEVTAFPTDNMMTLKGDQFGNGGIWDYFLDKSHGDNNAATANGMKNLFRLYTHQNGNDNIIFPKGSLHEGYFSGDEHLRSATYGSLGKVSEIDLSRIPSDAQIKLPEAVFGQDGIDAFGKLNTAAIDHVNQLVAAGHFTGADHVDHIIRGPGDAIKFLYENGTDQDKADAIILRLGYLGHDDALPTDPKDLNLILEKLGVSIPHTTPTIVPTSAPVVEPTTITQPTGLYEFRLTPTQMTDVPAHIEALNNTINLPYSLPTEVAAAEKAATLFADTRAEAIASMRADQVLPSTLPWFPIFLPYHAALELAPLAGEAMTGVMPLPQDMLFSPFGMEKAFLTKDAIASRKSPRLTENPQATLSQSEEIAWHLARLSEEDTQTLAGLNEQVATPLSPEVRAIVTIPMPGSQDTAYNRLSKYLGQTNPDGTPFDPKRVEFVIYDAVLANQVDPAAKSLIQTDAERFVREHPDMQVVYLSHAYTSPQGAGQIKRDITNFALSRLATAPEGNPDATIITDNGGHSVAETYLASSIHAFDAQPTLDMVAGENRLNPEAYQQFPMLFAQHRAFELFDAFVRHGESGSIPGIISGNTACRASVLAGVGGYNATSPVAEDRELAWMIKSARGDSSASILTMPELAATVDPSETAYRMLQHVGLADTSVARTANETYKNMPWADMAAKANDAYTPQHLEEDLNAFYNTIYPSLKASNPERFDAYFKRTMDSLGVQYELTDGTIHLINTDALPANMAAEIDLESFAKDAASEVVAATPQEPTTPRETLESMTGQSTETKPVTEPTEETSDTIASSISSPEIGPQDAPDAAPTPNQEPNLYAEAAAKFEDVVERTNYILKNTKESSASVDVTPGELMHYLKTRLELAGRTRITNGNIRVEGNTVTLNDMVAKSGLAGEAQFKTKLITDPQKGLVVDIRATNYHLPFVMKLFEGKIKHDLNHFDDVLKLHMSQKTPPEWKANRIDVVGEKISVTFAKKP